MYELSAINQANMNTLLEGIKVLDFTHVHAGPLCTYQLALMGADVLKVESLNGGDQMRQMGRPLAPNLSAGFIGQNANKRSIALDLKQSTGLEIAHKLVKESDVLVVNMRPGTPQRIGIGYDTCQEIQPKLVYCAISGYGQTGPESDRPAMDHLMQGESGMIMATGTPEQPSRVGFAIADAGTAVIASSAINAALFKALRSGEGSYLDISMLECCMALMGLNYYGFLATGQVNERPGINPLARIGSAGTWECASGTLLVNANNMRLFQRMVKAVGRSDLIEDPKFTNTVLLAQNCTELREIFGNIFKTDTASHWDQVLRQAGVPSGVLKSPAEVVQHAQLISRQSLATLNNIPQVDHPIDFLGAGFLVNNEPTTPDRPPPLLGQHTKEVLETLGYSTQAIDNLIQDHVVACAE